MFDCSLLTEVDFVFKHNDFWNDNSNKCDSFDNSFENNINLSQHINTNNFHKALKCNYCGKLFTHAGHIKTVHEGDKDFKCESCGKLFTQANSLTGYTKLVVL